MPVFEFRCPMCGKKFSALLGMTAEPDDTRCPNCGHTETQKLVSRFARYRSEDDRLDEIADRLEMSGEPETAAEMRTMMRDLGKALDDDAADDMEELLESDLAEESAEDSQDPS